MIRDHGPSRTTEMLINAAIEQDQTDTQAILSAMRSREVAMLDPERPILTTLMNPFCRKGMTASDAAYAMQWFTDKVTRSGRLCADTRRAKRLLNYMAGQGWVVELGRERTLACGSQPVGTYVTVGYIDEVEQAIATRYGKGE
jgi:hypothetical protein